jgi:hypothetical protein
MKFKIIEDAKRQARMCFKGIAFTMLVEIPDDKVVEGEDAYYVYSVDGEKRYLVTEKVVKFNRTALKNMGKRKVEKVDPRMIGGEDKMIVKVGKPGSRERIEELAKQYSVVSKFEMSPFED